MSFSMRAIGYNFSNPNNLFNFPSSMEDFSFQDLFLLLINALQGKENNISDSPATNSFLKALSQGKGSYLDINSLEKQVGEGRNTNTNFEVFSEKLWNFYLNFILLLSYQISTTKDLRESIPSNSLLIQDVNTHEKNISLDLFLTKLQSFLQKEIRPINLKSNLRENSNLLNLLEKNLEERLANSNLFNPEERKILVNGIREFLELVKRELNNTFQEGKPLINPFEEDNRKTNNIERDNLDIKDSRTFEGFRHDHKNISSYNKLFPMQRELAKNLVHDLTKDIAITRDIQEKISKILTNSSYEEFLPLEGLSKEPYLATNLEKGFLSFKRENKLVDLKTYGLETWEGLPTSREMPINSDFKAQALREQGKGDMAIRLENFLQVIKNFVIELKPTGERKATIELEPPSLGKIDLKIKVKEGEVEIEAQVEKHETLSQLRQELPQIKEDLESLGLKLKDFNLSLGLAAEERGNKERRDLEKMKEEREPLRENNLKDDLSERSIISFHKGRLYKIA